MDNDILDFPSEFPSSTQLAQTATGQPRELPRIRKSGVVFLLGVAGHQRAGVNAAKASKLFAATRAVANRFKGEFEKDTDGVSYQMEVREFNTIRELVGHRPTGRSPWELAVLVTHGSGPDPGIHGNFIFLGDKDYDISELLDFQNLNAQKWSAFKSGFSRDGDVILLACGAGASGPDIPNYVREFFGTDGSLYAPKVYIAPTAAGTMIKPLLNESGQIVIQDGNILSGGPVNFPADFKHLPKKDIPVIVQPVQEDPFSD